MSARKIKMTIGSVVLEAELLDTPTAEAIWNALPLTSSPQVLALEVNGSAFQMASAVGVFRSSASSVTEPMVILILRADIIIGPPVAWSDAPSGLWPTHPQH